MARKITTAVMFVLLWALSLTQWEALPCAAKSFFNSDQDFLYMQNLGEGKCMPQVAGVIARFFKRRNPRLNEKTVNGYARCILETSRKYGVDPLLVAAIVVKESNADTSVKNGGCLGLMQVNWSAHRRSLPRIFPEIKTKKDLMQPRKNIEAGIYLFASFLNLAKGNTDRALDRYKGADNSKYKGKLLASYREMTSMLRAAGNLPGSISGSTCAKLRPTPVPIKPFSFAPLPADNPLLLSAKTKK